MVTTMRKSTAATANKSTSSTKKTADHPTYESMIAEAINSLKERKGSSRLAIKKYIIANFKVTPGAHFDAQISAAIKRGLSKKVFSLPKGMSGTIKLVKPEKKFAKDKKPAETHKKSVNQVNEKTPSARSSKRSTGVSKKAQKETKVQTPAAKRALEDKKPKRSKQPTTEKTTEKANIKAPVKLTKRQAAMKAASDSIA